MRKNLVLNCGILLLACIVIGGVLIGAANYFPINEDCKNASLSEIASEGLFPEVPAMQGGYGSFHSLNPTALELATDSLMLKMALYEGDGEGIIQAFRCYSTQYEEEYSRYWHGYVAVLRLMLFFFDYYEIRIINGLCQGLLAALAAFYIWKQKDTRYALAAIFSYVLLMPMALAHCLQYSWVFYVSFGALLIYVKHRDYWEQGYRYLYFFLLAGAVTIYLDLLTYPLLTWGLPITWWIILQDMESGGSKRKETVACLKKVVFSAVAWIAGYAGMWIGKWALGSIILRENLFQKAISEALLWTVNEGEEAITMRDRLYALYRNWCTYEYKLYYMLLATCLLYWIIKWFLSGWRKDRKAPALLLIFCSSIVWYLVLAGHATMHHIFTHRIFGVSIAAFMGMILLSTENKTIPCKDISRLVGKAAALVGVGAAAFLFMRQIKDDYLVHNGECSFRKLEIKEAVSMTFTPAFSEIPFLYVGFSVENGEEGCLRIQLMDQDTAADEIVLPFEEYSGGNFHKIDVDWKLNAGYSYTLLAEPVNNDGEVYLWVTEDGVMSLSEYGEAVMGGRQLSGQMLAGIDYRCQLRDFSRALFFTVSFMGAGMMILYVCCSIWDNPKKHRAE